MKRIQRKRTKGWRMPEGAVYVGRPTRWGNPFFSGVAADNAENFRRWMVGWIESNGWMDPGYLDSLRSATALACWCPLDQPCHADVLIELLTPTPSASHPQATPDVVSGDSHAP